MRRRNAYGERTGRPTAVVVPDTLLFVGVDVEVDPDGEVPSASASSLPNLACEQVSEGRVGVGQ